MTAPLPADPTPPARCPRCHAALPADAPAGLCPACLVSAHFGADATEPPAADGAAGAPVPEIADLAPHFPQLEILACLGRGGMGVVYKARQKSLGRLVALKLLAPERVGDPAFAERFAREARALARLDHPHIVTIHDFGQAGGYFYLLMEFVDGVSLRQLVRDGRIAPREALAIVPQICDALQFAHDHGIVHRDIKPDNILLDRRGHAKVADFGLAKLIEPATDQSGSAAEPIGHSSCQTSASNALEDIGHSPGLTEAGGVMGTPRYMAPEQREHPAAVDHRADIYALGVVLYQMLTGELPDEKQLEPPSRRVRLDVRLDEIVLRALEKDPERRYANATEFKTTLADLDALPPLTPPPPPPPPSTTPPAPSATDTPPSTEARAAGLARLKPAAIALIVTSALNLVGLAFGLIAGAVILTALPMIGFGAGNFRGPDPLFRFFGHSMHLAGAAAGLAFTLVVGWMLLHAAANIFVITSARRMLAGRDPGRARTGAIVAIVLGVLGLLYGLSSAALQTLWALLQLGAGIWALVLMKQPDIRAAFSATAATPSPEAATPTPPTAIIASLKTPARRVRVPAIGLLVSAGLQLLLLGVLAATFVLGASFNHADGRDTLRVAFLSSTRTSTTTPGDGIPPLWYSLAPYTLIGGLAIMALVLVAAWRMRRLRGHTFALIGSLLAMATIPVLGLVFGLWSLVVLLRRDVHAAFDDGAPRRRWKSALFAACSAGLLLAIFAAAQILVTLAWEHDRREARHAFVEQSRPTPFAPVPAPPSPELVVPDIPAPPGPSEPPAAPRADFAARYDAALRISDSTRRDQALAKLATDAVSAGQIKTAADAALRIGENALRDNTLHQLALPLRDAGRRDEALKLALRISEADLRDRTMQALAE